MDTNKLLIQRNLLKKTMRRFFEDQGFLEVETPVVVYCPGVEVHLQFFPTTYKNFQGSPKQLFLRTSPEIHLKKLLGAGAQRIFELAPCFRSQGELSPWHHPEFTMLEWYYIGACLDDLMTQTENLLNACSKVFKPNVKNKPIQRIKVSHLFKDVLGVSLNEKNPNFASELRQAGCISVKKDDDFETAFFKAMYDRIEPQLKEMGIVFLYDYPPSTAALANVQDGVAKRFECYVDGVELCNGFQELLGKNENRARVEYINAQRKLLYGDQIFHDEAFLEAIDAVKKPTVGNALGFDRLLAWLLGAASIDDVLPFREHHPYR